MVTIGLCKFSARGSNYKAHGSTLLIFCMRSGILVCMQISYLMQNSGEAPPETLSEQWLPQMPPLVLVWKEAERFPTSDRAYPLLEICYGTSAFTFLAEYRKGWQERDFQAALTTIQSMFSGQNRQPLRPASRGSVYPLIVLPYLSPERIVELERRQVCGLDYCGNGVLIVPDRWFIRATGQPNRFRREQGLHNPYSGKASLVARALFASPLHRKLEDLHHDILARGGSLSLAMVSRALQRLEEDVITRARKGCKVWLLQPDKLLDALQQAYAPHQGRLLWQGRVEVPDAALLPHLFANAQAGNLRLIVTGLGSATRHALLAMEKTARVYVETTIPPDLLLRGLNAVPTSRFPTLEIYAAPESAVYFDGEAGEEGVTWASPLQTYLEMMQQGDSRLRDSAAQVKARLLEQADRRKKELEAGVGT